MGLAIGWVVFSILAGVWASSKGRSGFGFFLLSLLASPLIGLIAVAIATPDAQAVVSAAVARGEGRRCPECAELVQCAARRCKHCGAALAPVAETYDPLTGQRPAPHLTPAQDKARAKGDRRTSLIYLAVLAVLAGALALNVYFFGH